jgi:histidinol phosphatase-like PHP family hydrolase
MKAYVEARGTKYRAVVQQDHQYFTIVDHRPKEEAAWLVKMFRKALRRHDKEKQKTRKK